MSTAEERAVERFAKERDDFERLALGLPVRPMTDQQTSRTNTSRCRHPWVERMRDDEADVSMWACTDCKRRFYPACDQCVTVGHREGHGEHIA